MARLMRWVGGLLVLAGAAALLLVLAAPATTPVAVRDCVRREAACLQLPTVTGATLNGDAIVLPDAFTAAINLVVMPFDREQQIDAAAFLPLFQAAAAETDDVAYYSIAALPDLAPPIRLLVSGGMRAAISDPALRAVTALLYLEDQAAFLAALSVPDASRIQVFAFNAAGEVLWQGAGDDPAAVVAALRAALGL